VAPITITPVVESKPSISVRIWFSVCSRSSFPPLKIPDPRDRPIAIYGGKTTLHLGGGRENFVLLPIIPPRKAVPAKAKATKAPKRAARKKRR